MEAIFIFRKSKTWGIISIILVLISVFLLIDILTPKVKVDKIDIKNLQTVVYTEFLQHVEGGEVAILYYTADKEDVYVKKTDGTHYKIINPEYEAFKHDMLKSNVEVRNTEEFINQNRQDNGAGSIFLFVLCLMGLVPSILRFAHLRLVEKNKRAEVIVGGATVSDGIKDKEKEKKNLDNSVKTFQDVAGLYEVKKDVQCLVDFLRNKEKYTSAGAKLPKGVIFYGPPGTGKTLLAKAIAGEAGVPFHYASGSDFVEMYAGVGAKRVRELFENAKKKTPCIIFIDEIDAIGSRRSKDDTNGEDRKTINALLTEMDGFKNSDNVLVIAATNRIEDLDLALTRPGRFTNKFCIPLPESAKERLEIIRLYGKNKRFSEDVDFNSLAKETIGFSPASIEALLNESAIISVQDNKPFIDKISIDKAMFKVLLSGHVKENQEDRSKEELQLVAWHEAGHALVGKLHGKEIPKVTILSTTSGAGGVTFTTPLKMGLHSVKDLKNEVQELYAGRIAELMLLKDKNEITTGASSDIQKATSIIKEIVTSYGMSDDFGMLNLNQLRVSQDVIVEKEIMLAKEIEQETIKMLTDNLSLLTAIANSLLESETLYEVDLNNLINEYKQEPL